MTSDHLIITLIRLPRTLRECKTKSIFSLLEETGYFDLENKDIELDIQRALSLNRECVFEWIHYSEDKRSSSGWYIKRDDKSEVVVGYLDIDGSRDEIHKFSDIYTGCAFFIKKEIDEIWGGYK